MTKITREKAREALVGIGFENPDVLLDLLLQKPDVSEGMNAFIRGHRGVATLTTGVPGDQVAPEPKRVDANAGTGKNAAPDVRKTADKMNEAIRALSGRGTR